MDAITPKELYRGIPRCVEYFAQRRKWQPLEANHHVLGCINGSTSSVYATLGAIRTPHVYVVSALMALVSKEPDAYVGSRMKPNGFYRDAARYWILRVHMFQNPLGECEHFEWEAPLHEWWLELYDLRNHPDKALRNPIFEKGAVAWAKSRQLPFK